MQSCSLGILHTGLQVSIYVVYFLTENLKILPSIGKRRQRTDGSRGTTSVRTVSSCNIFSVVILLLCTLTLLPLSPVCDHLKNRHQLRSAACAHLLVYEEKK